MARTSAESLLEVLPEPQAREQSAAFDDAAGGTGKGGTPSGRRAWWLAAVMGVLLIAAGIALPVRSTIAVNELHRLQTRWAWFKALDGQRAKLHARLADEAQDETDARVAAASAALAAEELPLLRRARSAVLAGWHLPDGGLRRLRQAMALAFSDQAGDLAQAADPRQSTGAIPERSAPTTSAVNRVDSLLDAELARWRQPLFNRPVAAPPLRAAGAALAQLATPADQPIDVRLVLAGPPGTLTTVDLGARGGPGQTSSRPFHSPFGQLTGPMVDRAGYLAVAAGNSPSGPPPVYAIRPDLSGEPRVIGSTFDNVVVAAAQPDGVWLQGSPGAVEVNGSGAILDEVPVASGRILVGATAQLLITSGLVSSEPSSDLQVIPLKGPLRGQASVLAAPAQLIAATSGHLAWLEIDPRGVIVVRLADAGAQHARTVAPLAAPDPAPSGPGQRTIQALPIDSGSFSPDATRLVVRYLTAVRGGIDTRLASIDVATAGVRLVDGSIGDHPAGPIAWTADGQRVFFIETTGARSRIGTWQVGTPGPTVIRIPAARVLSLAATTP